MFASQRKDGTGQFISLAISGGKVELREILQSSYENLVLMSYWYHIEEQ